MSKRESHVSIPGGYINREDRGPIDRLRSMWAYRDLLINMTRRELKVRYKASVLGFVWSLLNPLLYLVVFSFVFGAVLESDIPNYGIFLLSGLLAWGLFSAGTGGGTVSIVMNAPLVTKVWFPREILPVAAVGAALVHFFLQLFVLATALVVVRNTPSFEYMILLPLALLVLVLFTSALAIGLSALNVHLRDVQHLIELVLMAWFWFSAIVYPYNQVREKIGDWILVNPVVSTILTFQRVIYNPPVEANVIPDASLWWYARNLLIVGGGSVVLLVIALAVFGRLEANLGEDL